jgi:sec-independent protein translocase protein TatB
MFNLGFAEILVLSVIALLVIGPKQLPEVARTIGRLMAELKRATGDVTKTFVDAKTEVDDMARETRHQVQEQLSVQDIQQMLEEKAGIAEAKETMSEIKNQVEGHGSSDEREAAALTPAEPVNETESASLGEEPASDKKDSDG